MARLSDPKLLHPAEPALSVVAYAGAGKSGLSRVEGLGPSPTMYLVEDTGTRRLEQSEAPTRAEVFFRDALSLAA